MSFLSPIPAIDDARIVAAIAAAEQRTSGEIRVYISAHKVREPVRAAEKQFARLHMAETARRNGVLIFLAPASHTFAVIGDQGIHAQCGDAFWQELAAAMSERFKHGDFTEGLALGIERAGALLAQHFPRESTDRNELPDRIERSE